VGRIIRGVLEWARARVDERAFMRLAGSVKGARDLSSREGLTVVAFDCTDHWPQLEALAARYADRNLDLADLCVIRLSELHPYHTVITTDRSDFRVYRSNKPETIPILCPPQS
jgi:hypothetical protein